jgi:HAMP domain-containing protein
MLRLGVQQMSSSSHAVEVRAVRMLYGTALVFGGVSVFQAMQYLDDKLDVHGEVTEMRGEIKEMRGEIKEMRGEIKIMRGGINEMRGDEADQK